MGDELDAAEPEFELSDFEAYNAALSPIMKADSRVGVAVLRLSRETPLFVHHWWKLADPHVRNQRHPHESQKIPSETEY